MGGCSHIIHARPILKTKHPPATTPRRTTSGFFFFHRPGTPSLHQALTRRGMLVESHEGRPASYQELRLHGGCIHFMHSRSRVTTGHRILTTPGRRTSRFHRPRRHCLHRARSAVRDSASPTRVRRGGGRGQQAVVARLAVMLHGVHSRGADARCLACVIGRAGMPPLIGDNFVGVRSVSIPTG